MIERSPARRSAIFGNFFPALVAATLIASVSADSLAAEDSDSLARQLLARHHQQIEPLEVDAARCFWEANVKGTPDAYRLKDEADSRLDEALADRNWFEQLQRCDSADLADPLVSRQIHLLHLQSLPKQLDLKLLKQLTARGNAIEMRYNAFRARVGDERLTDNDVRKVLRESHDSDRRRAVWLASKALGRDLEPELLAIVRLRNRAARQLGFADYHSLLLAVGEQTPDEVMRLFDEVADLTREPFLAAKRGIDERLAQRCRVAVEELRPWHYHDLCFRDAPLLDADGLDSVYARIDVVDLCRRFYAGIGLTIDDVLKQSDLQQRPNKHPSAFAIDIDRAGDVRVLANLVPTQHSAATMLHELGHAVYSSQTMPDDLPYLLRCESHLLTTEGVAMLFERFAKSPEWLKQMGTTIEDETLDAAALKARRNSLLVFSRYSQVVFRFERELYHDPEQDLNRRWWELVEEYQAVPRPLGRDQPDYASQLHIATAPAYFHNYLLGELFACQLHAAIVRDALGGGDPQSASYVGRREVGNFLRRRVFAPGKRLDWNELTKFATGEELNARAFAAEIAE
jgi:peptidyl-dipeptidase A